MEVSERFYGSGMLCIALLFLLTGYSEQLCAQQSRSINGKVTDQQGNALTGASVYLSHTSVGVTTSNTGTFNLENLPEGKFDLVVSAIGFETKILSVSSDQYPSNLVIALSSRATELAAVVIEPTDKDGWRKYGRYFVQNFIGTTRNARYCKILNPEVLRFKFSEKNNRLIVKADEPVIIENKILGYKISFQLVEFRADMDEGVISYYGHPFFSELKDSDEEMRSEIISNRSKAYYGSLMHFMRAAYEDEIKKEKFIVRTTITKPNFEKERVKKIVEDTTGYQRSRYEISEVFRGTTHVTGISDTALISQDSVRYYKKVLRQRDTLTQEVTLESINEIAILTRAFSKFIFFENAMEVVYVGNNKGKGELSEMILQTPKALEILKNGSYFSPTELVTFKFWSKEEKMCNMLPLDYHPD